MIEHEENEEAKDDRGGHLQRHLGQATNAYVSDRFFIKEHNYSLAGVLLSPLWMRFVMSCSSFTRSAANFRMPSASLKEAMSSSFICLSSVQREHNIVDQMQAYHANILASGTNLVGTFCSFVGSSLRVTGWVDLASSSRRPGLMLR